MKSPHPPSTNPHRGFSPVGLENVSTISGYGANGTTKSGILLKDMKESYDIGSPHDPLYRNIWPPPGTHDTFEPTFTHFFQTCHTIQLTILHALSLGLGLSPTTLPSLHAHQHNELRLIHYPPAPLTAFTDSTRVAVHSDFGTITLLFQDRVGGLQVESPPYSNSFHEITSHGLQECIVNVGDCLEKWTGGRLRSARHRVHLPERKEESGEEGIVEERFSIAYFAKPDRSASLKPLVGKEAEEEGDDGKWMTAGEFQNMRINGTY
ncbi:MAG: hypothetical protein M1820_003103 [Bogoriella megaspora]|nr:MAG: hypothetical protein M1820_003103 [Bogoriella megaspora]